MRQRRSDTPRQCWPPFKAWSLLNSNWVAADDYCLRQRPCHSAHAPEESSPASPEGAAAGLKRWFNERDGEREKENQEVKLLEETQSLVHTGGPNAKLMNKFGNSPNNLGVRLNDSLLLPFVLVHVIERFVAVIQF